MQNFQDPKRLRQFIRMTSENFHEVLHMVGNRIVKQKTNAKDPIPPEERLAVTLRFLAEGKS